MCLSRDRGKLDGSDYMPSHKMAVDATTAASLQGMVSQACLDVPQALVVCSHSVLRGGEREAGGSKRISTGIRCVMSVLLDDILRFGDAIHLWVGDIGKPRNIYAQFQGVCATFLVPSTV